VHIGGIQVADFRNYSSLSWSPSPTLNLLTGANAQGKTNLLEAIAFLATGRSFRTSRLGELPRWGADEASLSGEIKRADASRTIRRTLERGESGAWHAAGGGDCPWARVVVFSWQDLEILNGLPVVRRRFLDGFAARLYPPHRATLIRYRQVVARRNHVLQDRRPDGEHAARLAPWDDQLITLGLELIDRRRRAAAALQTEVARIYPSLAGDRDKIEIRYRSALGDVADAATFRAALARRHAAERARGVTLVGPHRDDLTIELAGIDARAFGSRGQQRLLALALRLAEVLPISDAVGTPPVLLLDDALSELDSRARENVLREITTADQVFLTSPEGLDVPGAARWTVDAGAVSAAP
jgi:DNA replication and repair protein RecF